MKPYQLLFIEFLLENNALKFGEFTLKSGRISPYFFNLGMFKTGAALAKLGEFYATALEESGFKYDVLFGPAYKGIPLVSATSIALFHQFGKDVPYSFNRKEIKDHGDKGTVVGSTLQGNVVMLDDVITAGTTVRETLQLIKQYQQYDAKLNGILIAFDRQERGLTELSAVQETQKTYGITVKSIISLNDVKQFLKTKRDLSQYLKQIEIYQAEYGA